MSEEIEYKEFSEEESRIYKKAMEMIRANIASGTKFDLACEFLAVDDSTLRSLIVDDALKVQLAEQHYGKGIPLLDLAKALGVSMERLLKATNEMMEDIVNTATKIAEQSEPKKPLTH